jgi:hypothetical protein
MKMTKPICNYFSFGCESRVGLGIPGSEVGIEEFTRIWLEYINGNLEDENTSFVEGCMHF